jgi:hypothetical protein
MKYAGPASHPDLNDEQLTSHMNHNSQYNNVLYILHVVFILQTLNFIYFVICHELLINVYFGVLPFIFKILKF